MKKEQIESSRHLCLDVETRWNSTYLMCESALIYRKAFKKLEMSDGGKFRSELDKNRGVPLDSDWERISSLLPFLKIFYDATLRLSGSLYITTNMFLQEIIGVGIMIKKKCDSLDTGVSAMAYRMKIKFGKYWEDHEKVNLLLYIAAILDPRRKLKYVNWAIDQQYGEDLVKAQKFRSKVTDTLYSMFAAYTSSQPLREASPTPQVEVNVDEFENATDWHDMVESQYQIDVSGEVINDKNDLDRYLEDVIEVNSKKFEILDWWNKREESYPILSLMAREVLAIPVSTCDSERAFSSGGRILDEFRSSLTSTMVEALVCTQDWLRISHGPLLAEEYLEEIEKIDQGNVLFFVLASVIE